MRRAKPGGSPPRGVNPARDFFRTESPASQRRRSGFLSAVCFVDSRVKPFGLSAACLRAARRSDDGRSRPFQKQQSPFPTHREGAVSDAIYPLGYFLRTGRTPAVVLCSATAGFNQALTGLTKRRIKPAAPACDGGAPRSRGSPRRGWRHRWRAREWPR